MVLEKTPESPLDSKEIKSVNLKGDPPWIFTGRTDAEAPAFWSSDAHRWLIGKVPDAGKDQGQKEKRVSEDKMAGWQWTWTCTNSRRWWGTRRPGLLQSMGSQGVRHNWATEQQWPTVCYLWSSSPQPHHHSLNIRQTQTEGYSTECLTSTPQVFSSSKTRQIWETGTVLRSLRRRDNWT